MNKELFNLLFRGYFPKELPPAFNTYDFAVQSDKIRYAVGEEWHNCISEPAVFSIPKNGIGRRMLSIPNPYSFYNLAALLSSDAIYSKLKSICSQSKISYSKPRRCANINKKAIIPNCKSVADFQTIKLLKGLYRRVELKIDISCFYSTIYTHAVTWMMLGKEKAKEIWRGRLVNSGYSSGDPNLDDLYNLTNQIDLLIECCQDKQTHGIPVGPDTSFLIAEALLCHIDGNIQKKFPTLQGCRYFDDWFLYVDSRDEATQLLKIVIDELAKFGLDVNISKVEINEMPVTVLDDFADKLSSFDFHNASNIERIKVFFEVLWALVRNGRSRAATFTRYAMRVLEGFLTQNVVRSLNPDNKELICMMLFRTVADLPECIPAVMSVLHVLGNIPYKDTLVRLIDSILHRHIALEHHVEVAWALWMSKIYDIEINSNRLIEVISGRNSVCSLLVLDYVHNVNPKLLSDTRVTNAITALSDSFRANSLYDNDWLVLYEGVLKGWLQGVDDLVDKDPFFSVLRQFGVSFYDTDPKVDYGSPEYLLASAKQLPEHVKDEIVAKTKKVTDGVMSAVEDLRLSIQDIGSENSMSLKFDRLAETVNNNVAEEIMRIVLMGEDVDVDSLMRKYSRFVRLVRIS